jgi:hypothetical protein
MKIQPGISITGPAVSDVVHLLAEIIENATIFSSRDTPVHISGQEIPSGGLLIEVSDSGVGAGLPIRVPRANLIAGSAGSHRAGATSRPADGRGTQTAPARAPRSPELARNRLSGFQRGTRRAKGQTPRAGEGADR